MIWIYITDITHMVINKAIIWNLIRFLLFQLFNFTLLVPWFIIFLMNH
jgi:hypothetical protein